MKSTGYCCQILMKLEFSRQFFFFENGDFCEIMWKNVVEWGRPQVTIWRIKGGEGPSDTTVVFDGPSPPFTVQTLRDGTP